MIDSRSPIGVEGKFRGNDNLYSLKGKNMECALFQDYPDAVPVLIAIFAIFGIFFALIVVIHHKGIDFLQDIFQGRLLLGARAVNARTNSEYNHALCISFRRLADSKRNAIT